MADIKLTPEELMAQAQEMTSLQGEFESLFGQVSTALQGMNDSWSENLASNFAGKITAAQKTFTSVTNMLGNGALVASKKCIYFQRTGESFGNSGNCRRRPCRGNAGFPEKLLKGD